MATFRETYRDLKDNLSRRITITAEAAGVLVGRSGVKDFRDRRETDHETAGRIAADVDHLSGTAPAENKIPLVQQFFKNHGRLRKWKKRLRILGEWLYQYWPWRELTDEEKFARAENAERKQLEKLLRDEAMIVEDKLVTALTANNICYRYPKSERDLAITGVQKVKFTTIAMQPEALYFQVDTKRRPRGIGLTQLWDQALIDDLSISVGHRVNAEYSPEVGLWYIVERATGVRGIPKHVKYQDVMEAMPKTADELSFPLGMAHNSRREYRSLKQMPHLLVAGATGTGKSNMVNVMLATLISRNRADELKILMVDLKGGMELTPYENIPHLLMIPGICETGIITERANVPTALAWLIAHGEERMSTIREAGHKNIGTYNTYRRTTRMSRILLVVDEWADIKLDRTVGRASEDMLANLAQRMRAVGIHVVLATQTPKKEVISTLIKSNMPGRMAFSCTDHTSSILIVDSIAARGLEPQGRYIYQKGAQTLTLQAPFISERQLDEIIQAAKQGISYAEMEHAKKHDVGIDEVLRWAWAENQGRLPVVGVYQKYKDRGVGKAEVESWLKELEGTDYELEGEIYRIEPGTNRKSRQMILASSVQHPGDN